MDPKKLAAAMLVVTAICLVPVMWDGSQADDLPYVLVGDIPEYEYTGHDIVPSELQKIQPAPGYEIVSSGLIGGDVVPAEGGVAEAPPFGYVPAARHLVGTYGLVYETVISDGVTESEYNIAVNWKIVPIRVEVSGFAEKVYDGSTAVRGGISVTAGGSTDIIGITEAVPYYDDKHAGESKNLRIRVVTDRIENYVFYLGDTKCNVMDKYVIVPGLGSVSKAPASVVGSPDREYDGTDAVRSELTVKDRVDGISVSSAAFLDVRAGSGVGIAVTMEGGSPSDYDFTFNGTPGRTSGDTVVFDGAGDIHRRTLSPVWLGDDYYFYTGEVLEIPGAEAFGVVDGESVPLGTECYPPGTEFREVGEYTLRAFISGDHPDYVLANVYGYAQIDPAPVKITGSADREYDGTKSVTGLVVGDGSVVPDSTEFTDRLVGSGKDIVLTFEDGYAHNLMFSYTKEDGTDALGIVGDGGKTVLLTDCATVSPREVTLEWTAPPVLVYSGYELEGPYAKAVGLVGDDILPLETSVVGGTPFLDAGRYSFSVSATVPDGNYTVPDETAEYTIAPADLDIVWTYGPMVYDGTEQAYPEAEAFGFIGDDSSSMEVVLLGSNRFAEAGRYTFEAVIHNPNYSVPESAMLKVEIGRCPLTVSGTAEKVYDGTNAFGGVLTLDGAVDSVAVVSKGFEDPGAGTGKTVVLGFSPGTASNYDMTWNGIAGTADGDTVSFPDIGSIDARPILADYIGGRFVQSGDELRLFATVSFGTLVCDDFTWTSGGTDYTDSGMPVGSGPVTVVVSAVPGSDWRGTAQAVIDVDAVYTVSVISGDNGTVSGDTVTVARGTPVSYSGSELTVGGTVFTAVPDSGYVFGSWDGVPDSGRVDSDLTVSASFGEYYPPDPPSVYIRSIEVTVSPDRVEYLQGDAFDPAGMKVVVNFSDSTTYPIVDYTWSPTVFVQGGPAVEVTISYRGAETSVFVKVEGAVPLPPIPVVGPEVDIPVEGDSMSAEEAAEAAGRIDAVREYDPAQVPLVTVHTETSEAFSAPVSLYESVRENGASLEVVTASGSVSMDPGSLSSLELPDSGDVTVGIESVDVTTDAFAYRISVSTDAGEVAARFGSPADAVLKFPMGEFGDDTKVYLVSEEGSQTEIGDVTYSEVGGEAFIAFPITETGLYSVQDVPDTASGGEGFGWWVLLIVLMMIAALGVAVYFSVKTE